MMFIRNFFIIVLVAFSSKSVAQSLYDFPRDVSSRVSSFENMNGGKGAGGKTNHTAKGHAFEMLKSGESKTLLDVDGQGIIQRMWFTVDQNPLMLRSLHLEIFWDDALKPAVDVPFGDFFGCNLGKEVAYESALFSTGEGRSFNCYASMPFHKKAKIILINESETQAAKLFYDIDFILTKDLSQSALYFHANWSRQKTKHPGDDVFILPKINGSGRFIGMSAALLTDSVYSNTWWGEGEVKMYIDGDSTYPTINGTGAEDYLGSAWGLGKFINQYQGCTVADTVTGAYDFYRLHIPDAIYFHTNIKVTWQQIGGGNIDVVKALLKKGVKLRPVSVDNDDGFYRLFETKDTSLENYKKGWVNFYRTDDYAITAYYYLDKPGSDLPPLQNVGDRIKNVK